MMSLTYSLTYGQTQHFKVKDKDNDVCVIHVEGQSTPAPASCLLSLCLQGVQSSWCCGQCSS